MGPSLLINEYVLGDCYRAHSSMLGKKSGGGKKRKAKSPIGTPATKKKKTEHNPTPKATKSTATSAGVTPKATTTLKLKRKSKAIPTLVQHCLDRLSTVSPDELQTGHIAHESLDAVFATLVRPDNKAKIKFTQLAVLFPFVTKVDLSSMCFDVKLLFGCRSLQYICLSDTWVNDQDVIQIVRNNPNIKVQIKKKITTRKKG